MVRHVKQPPPEPVTGHQSALHLLWNGTRRPFTMVSINAVTICKGAGTGTPSPGERCGRRRSLGRGDPDNLLGVGRVTFELAACSTTKRTQLGDGAELMGEPASDAGGTTAPSLNTIHGSKAHSAFGLGSDL